MMQPRQLCTQVDTIKGPVSRETAHGNLAQENSVKSRGMFQQFAQKLGSFLTRLLTHHQQITRINHVLTIFWHLTSTYRGHPVPLIERHKFVPQICPKTSQLSRTNDRSQKFGRRYCKAGTACNVKLRLHMCSMWKKPLQQGP